MLVRFFLTSFWRISSVRLLETLCTYFSWFAIEVRLKPALDFQNGLCGPWPLISFVQATTFTPNPQKQGKSYIASTKAQQFFSQNLYSVNIPNSLALLLCFSSVLATAPDAVLLWPLLPGDADWQTDEEGVVIKHAWSSTCLLLWRWFCSIYNVWEQKHLPYIVYCNCKIRMCLLILSCLASYHYM